MHRYQEKIDKKYGKGRYTILLEESVKDTSYDDKQKRLTFNLHIRCNICGNIFVRSIPSLRSYLDGSVKGDLCPKCKQIEYEKERLNIFIKEFNIRNKEGFIGLDFDFSNAYIKSIYLINSHPYGKIFNIHCNKCGAIFDIFTSNLLKRMSCPHCTKSTGELLIENWLNEHSILYNEQVRLRNEETNRLGHSRGLVIDFTVELNNKTYWIEYHGEQHYVYCPFFKDGIDDFFTQLKRDEFISSYSQRNNIILIELPWTLKSVEIVNILQEVLINDNPCPEYNFPEIKLERGKDNPSTGLHRNEFLKERGFIL